MATDWVEKIKDTAQEHVSEPVEAVGILQPAGTWGTFGLEHISGVAAMFKARKANKAAGGLGKTSVWKGTKTALLAITAEKVYAFSAKPRGRTWKVQDQLGVWNRRDLEVETTPGRLSTRVVIDVVATGEHFELEATTAGDRGFHDRFLSALERIS